MGLVHFMPMPSKEEYYRDPDFWERKLQERIKSGRRRARRETIALSIGLAILVAVWIVVVVTWAEGRA